MSPRRRIVHVVTLGDVGGAQAHVRDLAIAQAAAGHHVTVLVGSGGAMVEALAAAGVRTVVEPAIRHAVRPVHDTRTVATVQRHLTDARAELVHTHSSKGGLLGRLAARRAGIPVVYTAHGWPFQAGAALRQRALSFTAERAVGRIGHVICLTAAERDLAIRARIASPDRIHVVPLGLPDVAPAQRAVAPLPAAAVMVARFDPPKQQGALVEVVAALSDVHATIDFVGDGASRPSVEAAAAVRAPHAVRFLGAVPAAEVLGGYGVSVLWSAYEGMPLAMLESMRAGLACVASDLPGTRALFGDDAGLTAGTTDELAAALRRVITDQGLRDELGARARRRYETEFGIALMVQRTDAVYDAASG